MYGFKFMLRAAWPQLLMIVVAFVCIIGASYSSVHDRQVTKANRESAPCINFNETPIQEVPARCFAYFSEHK